MQVGGPSNVVRPIANNFETDDSQALYQEPFAALNNPENTDMTYVKQGTIQEDFIMQHQQQQQLLMMQGVSMTLDNKGKITISKFFGVWRN